MSELNSFCKKVKSVAGKAVKKTGEFADLAAKYVRLHSMDSKLDDRYEMLGRLTYKQLKTGESQAEKIAAYIESIDKIRADRKALQAEIDAEKALFDKTNSYIEEFKGWKKGIINKARIITIKTI